MKRDDEGVRAKARSETGYIHANPSLKAGVNYFGSLLMQGL